LECAAQRGRRPAWKSRPVSGKIVWVELLKNSNDPRLWKAVVAVLRTTVAFQCLGNWRLLVRVEESPLMALFWDQPDVGGWGWSEQAAMATQHTLGWLALLAGLCVLVRPCAAVLGPLVLLQLIIAIAMSRTDSGYPLQIEWLPSQLTAWFPLVTQSARIAAPLGLLLLDPWRAEHSLGEKRIAWGIGVLRWSIALTFLAHGWESWQHNPVFVDMLINSAQQMLGLELAQQSAETMLSIVGVVDIVLGVACVGLRWQSVLWWMVFWGVATATSRVVANGWEIAWHDTLTRLPHAGVPLAIVLHWQQLHYRATKSEADPQKD